MVAGAVGIDHALLVVAADDGPMPQTREHLAILGLLGVDAGTVALTKVDRVGPERRAQVHAELAALLAGTPLAGAPVFETAATDPDDPGVAALRARLLAAAAAHRGRAASGRFRLAVDRVFTLAGQGTAVTGTVFSGRVGVGDTPVHSGSGRALRVRSLHAQNRPANEGRAGERCALVLAGIERDAVARGDWIADGEALVSTPRLDVRLQLLADAPALAHWTPVHVHLGTTHRSAHLVPLDETPPAPGTSARVQLVLDAPVFALPGDRLILRNAQATRTIAGGRVIDCWAPERKRRSAERLAWLDALEAAQAAPGAAAVERLLERAPNGVPRSRLRLWLGREPEPGPLPQAGAAAAVAPAAQAVLQPLPAGESTGERGARVAIPLPPADELWLSSTAWQRWRERVLSTLAAFHERSPDEPGVNAARLARMLRPGRPDAAADALWSALLAAMLADGTLARQGAWLHLPGHAVELSAAERALAERLLPLLADGGADPPWVRDLAALTGAPEATVRTVARKLSRRGELQQVVKDLFYPEASVAALLRTFDALAAARPGGLVDARDFRDATGLGRKRAIQVLEHLDRVGLTRRVRDARVRRDAAPAAAAATAAAVTGPAPASDPPPAPPAAGC